MDQGRVHRALVSYRASINILGTHYQLMTSIARKLMALEQYDAAKGLLVLAWKQDPDIVVAPANLAVIASEQGNAQDTQRYCTIAISLGKDDSICYHLLAWAYAEQGRWPEAAEARKQAIARGEGDYWQQWESLAFMEWHRGDTAAARTAFDSAVAKARGRFALERVDSLRNALLGTPTGVLR
jgi:tetratricopeptide (TPR) repeat protein